MRVIIPVLLLCTCSVVVNGNRIQVNLAADRPSVRVPVSHTAQLQCCFTTTGGSVGFVWITSIHSRVNGTRPSRRVNTTDVRVTFGEAEGGGCRTLTLREVRLEDAGLYQCRLSHTDLRPSVHTHGTYLQVYRPMVKTLNISDTVKNRILTAEGVLLLLCVLLPGASVLLKSKRRSTLAKKRAMKEDENIYEGLNLDDCGTTYDQIQRAREQEAYQDVGFRVEEEDYEEEEIQLEKP